MRSHTVTDNSLNYHLDFSTYDFDIIVEKNENIFFVNILCAW